MKLIAFQRALTICGHADRMMWDDADETDLIQQLRLGNRDALAELFTRYCGRLRFFVRRQLDTRLGPRISDSDVLQDIYLCASQRVRHFANAQPPLPFFVWLRLLAQQRITDLYRRHLGSAMRDVRREVSLNKRLQLQDTSFVFAQRLISPLRSPSEAASLREKADFLEAALAQMNELDREIVGLRHFGELSNAEAASILGIARSAASKRYVRAMRRLKKLLETLSALHSMTTSDVSL